MWQQLGPIIGNSKWPQVGVECIRIRNGELAAHMVGEPIPRRISHVDLTVRLSNDYADMVLHVSGMPKQKQHPLHHLLQGFPGYDSSAVSCVAGEPCR